MTLVDNRLIYPVQVTSTQFEKNDSQWKLLTAGLLGPFGYTFPDPPSGFIRKYRLRAIYSDENAGGNYHLEVKIDLPNNPVVFRLPTVASGQGANAQGFSDWYQFGNGTKGEIQKGHSSLYARFVSNAPYNNHASIFHLTLEAHDFPQ